MKSKVNDMLFKRAKRYVRNWTSEDMKWIEYYKADPQIKALMRLLKLSYNEGVGEGNANRHQ